MDVAFKVVGTGSVSTRDYVILCFGNGSKDPLFLQMKEEPPSAYAQYLKAQVLSRNQESVVQGQRLMQAQSDIFLGWTRMDGRDYLVRQLNRCCAIQAPRISPDTRRACVRAHCYQWLETPGVDRPTLHAHKAMKK